MRILLVEDDMDLREIMAFQFEHAGIAVACASDGVDALDSLTRQQFDVVLSDERMPRMRGSELLKRVREKWGSRPFFYIMTGYTNADVRELISSGANGVLDKPVNVSRFLADIGKLEP